MNRFFYLTIAASLLSIGSVEAETGQSGARTTGEPTRETNAKGLQLQPMEFTVQTKLFGDDSPLSQAATDELGESGEFSFQAQARTFDPTVELLTGPTSETDPLLALLSRFIKAAHTSDYEGMKACYPPEDHADLLAFLDDPAVKQKVAEQYAALSSYRLTLVVQMESGVVFAFSQADSSTMPNLAGYIPVAVRMKDGKPQLHIPSDDEPRLATLLVALQKDALKVKTSPASQ